MSASERRPGDANALRGLIDGIREFSDSEYQHRVWVLGEGIEVTSYTDAMLAVLEDFRIDEFAGALGDEFGLTILQRRALASFSDVLTRFDDAVPSRDLPDEQIQRLPGWAGVVAAAREALRLLQTGANLAPHFRARIRMRTSDEGGRVHGVDLEKYRPDIPDLRGEPCMFGVHFNHDTGRLDPGETQDLRVWVRSAAPEFMRYARVGGRFTLNEGPTIVADGTFLEILRTDA